jgi:hypothetical protein
VVVVETEGYVGRNKTINKDFFLNFMYINIEAAYIIDLADIVLVIRVDQVPRTVIDALRVLIAFTIVITTFFSATAIMFNNISSSSLGSAISAKIFRV